MAFLPFPSAWSTKQKGKSVPSVSSTPVSHSFRHVLSWSCRSLQCFWEQPGWNAKGRKLLICSQLIISQCSWFFSDWMHFAMDSDGWATLTRPLQKPIYGTHRCRMRKKKFPYNLTKICKKKGDERKNGTKSMPFFSGLQTFLSRPTFLLANGRKTALNFKTKNKNFHQ